jgi:hypothetical protein
MSGTIIEFRRNRGFGKLRRTGKAWPDSRDQQRQLEQQIARITALLDELEDLNGSAEEKVPVWLVAEAQAGLRRARNNLQPAPEHLRGISDEPDPQPQIDREILERMYRSLDPQR